MVLGKESEVLEFKKTTGELKDAIISNKIFELYLTNYFTVNDNSEAVVPDNREQFFNYGTQIGRE